MEKEAPRKSTKKKQEKESERRVEEHSAPHVKLPSESKSKTFTAEVNNLSEIAEPTKTSETKVPKQSSSVTPKFSAVVVAQGQSQKIKEAPVPLQAEARKKLSSDQLEIEADLYADIATLNSLMSSFEKGNTDIATYKRQVQSLITDVTKCKVMLEKTGITMQEFIREEKIMEQYPLVCEKFKSLESDETLVSFIESLSVTKADVASGTAMIVTDLITLSDYAKLGGDVAKVESLIPLIEGLVKLLQDFPTTRKDYWGLALLKDWNTRLSALPVDAVLNANEARRLETDVNRILNDFKRRLREI